uniref:Uncharacterized protein n=1 Tax=Anguilla anguilla TaxID=7936 RepID=A0A0E9U931_ANGAN
MLPNSAASQLKFPVFGRFLLCVSQSAIIKRSHLLIDCEHVQPKMTIIQ